MSFGQLNRHHTEELLRGLRRPERAAEVELEARAIDDGRRAVACPECGAQLGEPCLSAGGWSHFARGLAYAKRGAA